MKSTQYVSFILSYHLYKQDIIPILQMKLRLRNISYIFPRSHTILLSILSTDVHPSLLWHAQEWRSLFFHVEDILNGTLSLIYEKSSKHSLAPATKWDMLKMVKGKQQERELSEGVNMFFLGLLFLSGPSKNQDTARKNRLFCSHDFLRAWGWSSSSSRKMADLA